MHVNESFLRRDIYLIDEISDQTSEDIVPEKIIHAEKGTDIPDEQRTFFAEEENFR